ncbi:MAG TPA: GDYXXLXY domain-containing protein [Trichormus sp.]|jgi:uncharacterized membrane-anchored protein
MKTDTVLDRPCAAQIASSLKPMINQRSTAYCGLRKQFFAVVSAQILLLVGLAAPKAYTLCHGQTISLQANLFDPSDPFRGEFENLTFAGITRVPVQGNAKRNEAVWITLSKSAKGSWAATSLAKQKPMLKKGELALKGTTTSDAYPDTNNGNKMVVEVSYGFEHLYVPQGKSSKLNITNETPLTAAIAVDAASGEGCIKQVSFKGHKIFDATDLMHPYCAELL